MLVETVVYIYSQSINLLSLPRVNRSCTCERNMHVTVPLLVNGSCMCEQDLQLTSASPHVNGTVAQGNAEKHEIHVGISTYHAITRQALSYTMPCPPGHTIYHATSPGHTIYHVMPARRYTMPYLARPYHMACHARQAISYTMPNFARPHHIPCHADNVIQYTVPYLVRPYDILCHVRQAIPYTMPYPTRQ